tara:strand:+ start:2849 stop:3445 length:597 start_codon:yes stop_codon:yes gene_type:complete
MEEAYPQLGGVGEAVIPWFVELAKGRPWGPVADKFYRLLVNQFRYAHKPANIMQAREYLQAAWWVEEEDVSQFLYSVLLQRAFGDARTIGILAAYLVRYLFREDVFSRPGWEERHPSQDDRYYMKERFPRQPILFDESISLPTHERYLLYCVSMGYNVPQLSKLINRSLSQTERELARVKKEFRCLLTQEETHATNKS